MIVGAALYYHLSVSDKTQIELELLNDTGRLIYHGPNLSICRENRRVPAVLEERVEHR